MSRFLHAVFRRFFTLSLWEKWKHRTELRYWQMRKDAEGTLTNTHYPFFFTTHFGLDESFYHNKRVLDIGCGPRGSLEWADMTVRRVGLDPLADDYLALGADRHKMEYVASPSERIPFDDDSFDVVSSFNSLDHVADVGKTIEEMVRVLRPGGLCLLLVEVNHAPTPTEPHCLTPGVLASFGPKCDCLELDVYRASPSGVYQSIRDGKKVAEPRTTTVTGWLSAKLQKKVV